MDDKRFTKAEMIRIWTSIIVRVLFIIVGFAIAAWFIYHLSGLILLLILSIFFVYLIAPLVRPFEQPLYIAGRELRIPRAAAIIIVYALMGTVLYVGGRLLTGAVVQQVSNLQRELPGHVESVKSWLGRADNSLRNTLSEDAYNTFNEKILGLADKAEPLVESIVTSIVGFLPYLVYLILVPILAFFLLKDASKIEHGLVSFMPTERLQKRIRWLLLDVSRTLAAYIRAQITACIEIGALVSVGLIVLGVPYALVLGIVSGALEFFPMVGPLMAAATILVMTLITAPTKALAVVLFLIILRIVQDYIIYPKIVGHGIEMHPLIIILAVFGGHEVYGLLGVFLSIPFVAMIMVAYGHYVAYRGIQGIQPGAEAVALEQAESPPEAALQAPPGTAPALEK